MGCRYSLAIATQQNPPDCASNQEDDYKAVCAGAMRHLLEVHRLTSPERKKEQERLTAKTKKRKARCNENAPESKRWRLGMFGELTDASEDDHDDWRGAGTKSAKPGKVPGRDFDLVLRLRCLFGGVCRRRHVSRDCLFPHPPPLLQESTSSGCGGQNESPKARRAVLASGWVSVWVVWGDWEGCIGLNAYRVHHLST